MKTNEDYTYKITFRGKYLLLALLFLVGVPATAQVVINEVHYAPDVKTEAVEFVELFNAGPTARDLSGWQLTEGIEYTLPSNIAIPAGGYLIIAQNPAAFYTKFGVSALGPWSGRLNNDNDEIKLRNAEGGKEDEVIYQLGFPWPTVGDAPGHSIELINPLFDNDLGGNWRASNDSGPTPGAINSIHAANAPPQIRHVDHAPKEPHSGEAVVITAKITDPDGVASVNLTYQPVDPGSYISLTDSAYASNWTTIAMTDNGTGDDEMAGDSVYTATLPAAVQQHRRLVRYRISTSDNASNALTVPYADDPQPNFAYFCYDGVPAWQAAVQPGTTPVLDFRTNVMRRLPAVHLISKNSDIETSTWFERYTGDLYKWSGTLVYDGKVYDHIHYRTRGGFWRYAMVKNMWKFDFNRGHDLQMRDDYGKKLDTKWTKLNLGACIQQGDSGHRGEQGMFESVGSRLFHLAGLPSFKTSFLQLRIIDDSNEATTSQYEGDFWGLYLAIEQEDGRFLDEHGLPDGNLYKMEGGTGELNNLCPDGPSNKSDLNYILGNYGGPNNIPAASDAWWEAHWDLDSYYSYQTIVQAIHHYDINANKNYFYYHNPETDLWQVVPWDLDLTWANNMYHPSWGGLNTLADRILDADSNGTDLILPGTNRPAFRIAFRNRIREIRDLLLNQDQAGQLIDEQAALLRDPGSVPSILDADRAMWDYNPKMDSSTYFYPSYSDKARTGRFYQWPYEPSVTKDFEGCVKLMKNYVEERGYLLDVLALDEDIPYTPSIAYIGPGNYPVNGLQFARTSSFSDPQGSATFGAMEWRAGEVLDPSAPAYAPTEAPPYEIEAKWESGELADTSVISIPADALKVGHTYRVRMRYKDNTGRWSNWSDPEEFTTTESSAAGDLSNHLRISELMPDALGGSDFEFVELHNTSSSQTLDLAGATFTAGIDFAFPGGATLAPDGYLLLIGTTNEAAFRSYYGLSGGIAIGGSFKGNLSNSGEEITLKTASGGTKIISFEYDDSRHWPLAAAGAGHSLVPLSTTGQASGALDYPGNWRASTYVGGSPGTADPGPPTGSFILNEITAHTDYTDPSKPEYDSNDWIELCNTSAVPASLNHWYLSDDPSDPDKWPFPSTTIAAGDCIVFHEVDDFHNPISTGFGLDKAGEQVLLSYLPGTTDDRVVDAIGFKGQENERSLSRMADYWQASVRTEGTANAAALEGLRISEIMYWPAPFGGTNDNERDEFIEIHNPTISNILMQTVDEAWRIDGGVEYTFPDNTTVPAGSTLLVVGFDPADSATSNAFVAAYGLASPVRMFGPWSGKLGNRSERVALERPQAPDFPGDDYSWVVEDETVYGNQDPWPIAAAGNGSALARINDSLPGLAPTSWTAASPTPGSPTPSPDLDSDGDGMSDYAEWVCGTNPDNPDSVFVMGLNVGTGFSWPTIPGRNYSVYWTDDLTEPFVPIATGLAHPLSNYTDHAHATNAANFYRIGVGLE